MSQGATSAAATQMQSVGDICRHWQCQCQCQQAVDDQNQNQGARRPAVIRYPLYTIYVCVRVVCECVCARVFVCGGGARELASYAGSRSKKSPFRVTANGAARGRGPGASTGAGAGAAPPPPGPPRGAWRRRTPGGGGGGACAAPSPLL
jgi:hypothetical protein